MLLATLEPEINWGYFTPGYRYRVQKGYHGRKVVLQINEEEIILLNL